MAENETREIDRNATVEIEGAQLTLGELLNFNLDDVKETRGFKMPVGSYLFEGGKFSIYTVEITVKNEATDEEEKKSVPVINLPSKVEHVYAMTFRDPTEKMDETEVLGKNYRQSFFIKSAIDMGRLKAHLVDVGVLRKGISLEEALNAYETNKWVGRIIHTNNQNDPDRPFINLKDRSVKPATAEQIGAAAEIPQEAS